MQDKITLYRGIPAFSDLELAAIKQDITQNGLKPTSTSSRFSDTRGFMTQSEMEHLLNIGIASREQVHQTGSQSQYIFACGDEHGAKYYARNHRDSPMGLVVKFTTTLDNLIIDFYDYLGKIHLHNLTPKQIETVESIYGPISRHIPHLQAAASVSGASYFEHLEAICHDKELINSHLNNQRLLLGAGGGVHFKSSFLVKAPIERDSIISIDDCPPSVLATGSLKFNQI